MRSELISALGLLLLVAGAAALLSQGMVSRPVGPLPDALAVVVALPEGGYESAVVQLVGPGEQPLVRRTPGIVALGPGWARLLVVAPELDEEGRRWHRLEVRDLAERAPPYGLSLADDVRVMAVHEGGVVVETPAGPRFLGPDGRTREVKREDGAEGGRRRFKGPGFGFRLLGAEGETDSLRLQLPMIEESEAVELGIRAERVLGSWYLRMAELPSWEQALVRQVFKQEAAIPTSAEPARVDGTLSEWREVRALSVSKESQVLDGIEYWSGERDGAFGVAAQATPDRIVLAIRVRDDALVPGRDRLELELEGRSITLALPEGAEQLEGDGWTAVFAPARHGIAVEIGLTRRSSADASVPPEVAVHLVDHDPGQGSTRLASAAVGARLTP